MTDNYTNQEKKECEVKLFFVVVLSFLSISTYFFTFLWCVSQKNPHNLKEEKGFQENIYLALLRTRSLDCVSLVGCCCCFGAKTVVKNFFLYSILWVEK